MISEKIQKSGKAVVRWASLARTTSDEFQHLRAWHDVVVCINYASHKAVTLREVSVRIQVEVILKNLDSSGHQ